MKASLVLLLFCSFSLLGQKLPERLSETDFTIGKTISIQSKILKGERVLNVYLPQHYSADSTKTYPVIYLLDGSKDEDFIHIAGIVQFGSFSWINMLPETIVVGIANVDRKRDFTYPSQNSLDQEEFTTSGKSAHFIQFLEEELQPFIAANFKTSEEKTLIGQSLGGLLATEILFKKPELFDKYIIVSPSLWWDDEKLLNAPTPSFTSSKSIYIAGGKEGEVMERTAKTLYNRLNQQQDEKTRVFYEFLEDKDHGDALHIAVYHAFEKIFGSQKNTQ
ncbi:alpha/beta hydrolase [Leeuwenhoekiella palythoae]|uniref:Esterase n=1 Tax=Leeuwenhoekiella palythoae TaxID=573501 RepID=A0A1M5YXZ6_9FLAO|nr:alpha/beta hydrolase-fold protein [Leeuwenhoekiella palythoae]RXG29652.1 hypothetical protein DSM01_1754 [Leeuwenhoekiella palythoae]SHI16845.1 hypothetical protein SAMN04487999_2478 [Leeuwenhoekiella palythoae]